MFSYLISQVESSSKLLTVNDCFVTLCNMINDISPRVRALAIELAGQLQGVSAEHLLQTFDKKAKFKKI